MAEKKVATDDIMSPGEMKPLLALSKREPIQAAIGLTKDHDGVILLHKRLKPKKLLAQLKADARKAKVELDTASLRFGKAEVDGDYDPSMVRFFINKEAPGALRLKLLEVVKRIPYAKVEINIDAKFEEEPEEEGDGQEAGASPTTGTTTTAPPPLPPRAPPPPGAAAQAQAPLDANALRTTLAQLTLAIPKIANGDATVQDALSRLADTADGSLNAKDLAKAAEGIEALRRALAAAMEQAKLNAQAAGGGGAVTYAKSRLAWLAARKKVESDIETLRQRIIDTFKDDAIAPQLETSYKTRVAPVLATLDDSLADTLDDASNATDPAKRAELVKEAKAIMQKYAQYLTSEPLIKELDENPFMPLSIRATVGGTISTLSKAIR